tara:strand:+ start:6985 stop:7182 length:198 start_codon:yes stop_codon:yes gene_type:complete
MVRVKIEEIVDHLRTEMSKALKQAVENTIPDVEFDERELFRNFRRSVGRKCSTWENVPDQYVESD